MEQFAYPGFALIGNRGWSWSAGYSASDQMPEQRRNRHDAGQVLGSADKTRAKVAQVSAGSGTNSEAWNR